jgi:quinoprotein dehydrogenase-associated probable ABC transporter substrate-binding protein
MQMRQTLAVVAICAVIFPVARPAVAEGVFKVCADPNNPPFSDQKEGGFENKIAELFAKEQGKKVAYTWFPQRLGFIRNTLKAQEPDSETYKCDVVMGVPTGYELAATTKPYYRSTYTLVYRKNRSWDDIRSARDLDALSQDRKNRLRIAMFDGSPATTWLLKHGLVERGVPYQSMTGNAAVNTAQTLEKDLLADVIDMAIVWGPIAGYLVYHNKPGTFTVIPMKSEDGVRFEFPISMGVRFSDKARKEELNALIEKKAGEIEAILKKYHVPLLDKDGNLLTAGQ